MADELRELQNDILWTEKGHFTSASGLRAVRLLMGGVATVASTVAVATIVADHTTVAGVFALIGAVLSGLMTFLKPEEAAQQHLVAGRKLGTLRVEIRQALKLDVGVLTEQELRAKVADLAQRKAAIDEASPHVSDAAIWWVDRRFKRGDYTNQALAGAATASDSPTTLELPDAAS